MARIVASVPEWAVGTAHLELVYSRVPTPEVPLHGPQHLRGVVHSQYHRLCHPARPSKAIVKWLFHPSNRARIPLPGVSVRV